MIKDAGRSELTDAWKSESRNASEDGSTDSTGLNE
jgi:hypothetical protein